MKQGIVLLLFFTSLNLAAQPGDLEYAYSKKRFAELTEKLKVEPDNHQLIWERITLSGFNNTYFNIYKESGALKGNISYFEDLSELFDGLNKLIDNNIVIGNHNIAEFKMLRGRLYYFSGEKNKALEDYLSALNDNTSFRNAELNDDIYISIAAYYYNLEEKLTEKNARQVLKYINMVDPNSCHSNQTPDCFEKEKIELLKFLKEEEQLKSFYKKLILAEYNSYVETKVGIFITTDYIYNKNKFYFRTLRRINDLAEFYNEIGNYQKSKIIIEKLITLLPPDNDGQTYKAFPKEKIYVISNNEYSKRFFNLHDNNRYQELCWDYQDISDLIESIKKY